MTKRFTNIDQVHLSNNSKIIDFKMDGILPEEKLFFKMLELSLTSNCLGLGNSYCLHW